MTPDPREHRRPEPCPICHRGIVKEAHGGPHPSPGDHDSAYHVARAYGTWHPTLDPDPLTYVEPDPEPSSSPGTAVWIVAAGLVGLALVVGIAGYPASRS